MDTILAIDHAHKAAEHCCLTSREFVGRKHKVEIEPYYSTEPGFAEQDPQVFWNALCSGLPRVVADGQGWRRAV